MGAVSPSVDCVASRLEEAVSRGGVGRTGCSVRRGMGVPVPTRCIPRLALLTFVGLEPHTWSARDSSAPRHMPPLLLSTLD